jgi:hypothetical protein
MIFDKDAPRNIWFALHKRFFSKLVLYLFIGLIVGVITNRSYDWAFPRPVISFDKDAPAIQDFGGYFGIIIDRTRTRLCQLQSTQILLRRMNYKGQDIPVVLSLQQTSLFWPLLGESKFIRLFKKPDGLPPGVWMTQAVTTDECGMWASLFGGHFRESQPVPIELRSPLASPQLIITK